MCPTVSTRLNLFYYNMWYHTDGMLLFWFNDEQHHDCKFRENSLHEMCNELNYESVNCTSLLDLRLSKVKVYKELIHNILSCIPQHALHDVPNTMFTVHTRVRQLQGLLQHWTDMSHDTRISLMDKIKIELTIQREYVVDRHPLYSMHDPFSLSTTYFVARRSTTSHDGHRTTVFSNA